jgi:uncharacterized protein YjdB
MMIHNTSTGAWSLTNVLVRWGCTAQLDGNFNTSYGSPAYGLNVQGTLICPAAYTVNGTGAFSLMGAFGDTALLVVASPGGINGNITATGTLNFFYGSSYTFNGSVAQVTGTYLPASMAGTNVLTIDNAAGVTLSHTTHTYGTLAFVSGILNTGSFIMSTDGASGNVTGAGPNSYVNGTLEKLISGYPTINYEVGDLTYAPMSLAFSATGTGGSLGVKVTNGLHPGIATSGISSTNVANHYWTITNSSATGPATIDPKATYIFSDILGGANASFVTGRYSSGAWSSTMATTNTSLPYTSRPTTAIPRASLAGDYIFGNAFCGTLPITGAGILCAGATITLSDATPGGTWVSGTTSVATVGSTGIVTGIGTGAAMISYTVSGCTVTHPVTVTATAPIAGAGSVCAGATITLTDATPGGTWTSSAPAVGSVNPVGIVAGLSGGTTAISYTVSGCAPAMRIITVNPTAPITGAATLCTGSTITLSDAVPGGTWASSATSVATVGSSGVVTGIGAGTTTISYTVSGCTVTRVLTVTATASITGAGSLCVGTSTTLSDATPGGTWTSGTISVVTVGSTGIVTGISTGTSTISYTVSGCTPATMVVTVTTVTAPITGAGSVCAGATITLSDATPGGTWASSTPVVGTVSTAGIVSGLSGGTTTISYTVSGCPAATHIVSVNPTAPITGAGSLCAGSTITLSDAVPGGTWVSSATVVATIGSSGVVTGIGAGTATISYTVSGCTLTRLLTVTATAPITGAGSLCAGTGTTLSDVTPGGTWTSGTTSVATVGSTGTVTGISAGTTTISYTVSGCTPATMVVTVTAFTAAITGAGSICAGATITLSDATPGGTWTSSTPVVGTVSSAGIVSGLSGGTTTISYTVSGCPPATTVLTVNTLPFGISGPDSLCAGTSITLSDATTGGTWTSSDISVATIGSMGDVAGLTAGVTTISYTVFGCSTTLTLTVIPATSCALGGPNTRSLGSELKVFPNPNTGSFTFFLSSSVDEAINITIAEMTGRTIKSLTTTSNYRQDIFLDMPPGVYLVFANTSTGRIAAKVIIQ